MGNTITMSKPTVPVADQPWFKRNVPIVTFFTRTSTWFIMFLMALFDWAVLSKHVWHWQQLPDLRDGTPGQWVPMTTYDYCGAVLYLPMLASTAMFLAMLFIHLYFRSTIDRDTHDGTYQCDWGVLSSYERVYIRTFILIGLVIAFSIIGASLAHGGVPDQVSRWEAARINPAFSIALDVSVETFRRNAERYERITAMRENGVPAAVIFCLHQRESSGNFRCHPHEGSPLTGRTRFVPKGRLPLPANPPFTFEQSAADAYYVCDKLDRVNWKDVQTALQGIESFNGLGYQNNHPDVPSPYLWSGTNLYRRGKYTGDGHFDHFAVDKQLGCVAILLRLRQAGVRLSWEQS